MRLKSILYPTNSFALKFLAAVFSARYITIFLHHYMCEKKMNDLSGDAQECLSGHFAGVIKCMVNGELDMFISNDDVKNPRQHV